MKFFKALNTAAIHHFRLLLAVVLFSIIAVLNTSATQAADPTCFSANSKVACGKYFGTFDITLQATNANGIAPTSVVITSLTPGVTLSPQKPFYLVVNGQVKITVVGAAPGQVLEFSVEGSTVGEGSVAGTDLCCNGKVQVTIPANLNCPQPPFFISIKEFCELVVVDLGGSGYSSICHIKVKSSGIVNLPVNFAHFLKGTGSVKFLNASGPWSCSPSGVSGGDPMNCVLPANAMAAPFDTSIIDMMVTFSDAAAVKSAQACPEGLYDDKQLRRYCTGFTLKDKAVIEVPKLIEPPKLTCDARTAKLVKGVCLCTIRGMVPVSKASCGCPDGTRLRDGACRKNSPPPPPPPPKCGSGERLNSKGVCVQKPVICRPNERLVNGRCENRPVVCGPDKRLVNGRCLDRPLECPPGTRLSKNGRACLPIIQPCPPGTQRLNSGKCVVIEQKCPRGTVRRNGECIFVEQKCPRGTIRRDGECVFVEQKCPRGFVRRDGECIEVQPDCPRGTVLRDGECIAVEQRRCRFPKILIGDQCVRIRLPRPPRDEPTQDGPVLNDNPRPKRGCVDEVGEPTPCVQ